MQHDASSQLLPSTCHACELKIYADWLARRPQFQRREAVPVCGCRITNAAAHEFCLRWRCIMSADAWISCRRAINMDDVAKLARVVPKYFWSSLQLNISVADICRKQTMVVKHKYLCWPGVMTNSMSLASRTHDASPTIKVASRKQKSPPAGFHRDNIFRISMMNGLHSERLYFNDYMRRDGASYWQHYGKDAVF